MTPIKRGALIVFEGCDRCGKSTQSKLLTEFLEKVNIPVKRMAFPARESNIGQAINSYLTNKQELNDETIHLLFSANRWEHKSEMEHALMSGTTLVVDRYSYSGVAYSAAKGMSSEWCMAPEKGLLRPDIVFYLKTGINALADRDNFGDERYEKSEFQTRVAAEFERIYENEKSYWLCIDANHSIKSIHESIRDKARNVIKAAETEHLNVLKL